MVVRVLGFDCVHVGDFEVVSYSVFADGALRLNLADGSEKTLDWEEWIDIRQSGIADEWATKIRSRNGWGSKQVAAPGSGSVQGYVARTRIIGPLA